MIRRGIGLLLIIVAVASVGCTSSADGPLQTTKSLKGRLVGPDGQGAPLPKTP